MSAGPATMFGMDRPRWLPRTYAEVLTGVNAKVQENHHIELKSTYARTDSGRAELAKDLAALALDGGCLLIGLEEDELGRAKDVAPVDLPGFAERVDQSATQRCDPAIQLQAHQIPEAEDALTGVLVVDIPAHPLAPIMVDGRYYGRGEKGRRQLSDTEVVRLHQARAREADRIEQSVERARSRAFNKLPAPKVGRLVVVAEPSPPRRSDLLASDLARGDWTHWQREADRRAVAFVGDQDDRSPRLAECLYSTGGVVSPLEAMWGGVSPGRTATGVVLRGGPEDTAHGPGGYLEVHESGALVLALNHLTSWERSVGLLDWHRLITSTVYMVAMFEQVCRKVGAHGAVDIGVVTDQLTGLRALDRRDAFHDLPPYEADEYRRTTRISVAEVEADLTPAMERLWGPLLRSLGLVDRLMPE